MLDSFLTYTRFRLRGDASQAYSEPAFRHFLALERKRAAHSTRSFLLVLVSFKKRPEMSARISPAAAARLFSSLSLCVREVDFIGGYREWSIAGAGLVQGANPPPDLSSLPTASHTCCVADFQRAMASDWQSRLFSQSNLDGLNPMLGQV